MKELNEKILNTFEEFQKNVSLNTEKGVKVAGRRARKQALELIQQLKDFRKLSLEASKTPAE